MKFLDPLETLSDPTLVNAQTGAVIASSVEVARTSATRRRGLLGREGLPTGSALVITRCNAIHTMGMQFAIDVAFIDADGCVRKIVHRLRPRRIAIAPRAWAVIELAAGGLGPDCLQCRGPGLSGAAVERCACSRYSRCCRRVRAPSVYTANDCGQRNGPYRLIEDY